MTDKRIRVAVLSCFPPMEDNYKAPNSLVFQLIKHRPSNIDIDLFYYHQKDVPAEKISSSFSQLNLSSVYEMAEFAANKKEKLKRFINHYKNRQEINRLPAVLQSFLPPHNELKILKEKQYDLIWVYPIWGFNWLNEIKNSPIVISGMDAASLHYFRCAEMNLLIGESEKKNAQSSFLKFSALEKAVAEKPVKVHMVGLVDASWFNSKYNSSNAFYTPHPFNETKNVSASALKNASPVKLLITGQAESIYIRNELPKIIELFIDKSDTLKDNYELNFIGSGFSETAKQLRDSGYTVNETQWVHDFADSIAQMNVQLFPIAVGTGAKGKVLHAMAVGLLGIGTSFAFENLEIEEGKDYIRYESMEDLYKYLTDIAENREKYAVIAKSGFNGIHKNHNPELAALLFWNKALNK